MISNGKISKENSRSRTEERTDAERVFDSIPLFMRAIMHGSQSDSDSYNRTECRVLKVIDSHPGLSLSDLAARANMEKGSVSPMVQRFVENGFCDRQRDPNDRRLYRIFVAPAGRDFLEEHFRSMARHVEERLAPLPEERRRLMRDALATLQTIAEEIIG